MGGEITALLALDQAGTTGVAMGRLNLTSLTGVVMGITKRRIHRLEALAQAMKLADGDFTKLAVVFEDHSYLPASCGFGTATILGMGDARGRWHELLDSLGHPEKLRFDVETPVWRRQVLGLLPRTKAEAAKAAAVRWVMARHNAAAEDHNAAEARCMLEWFARNQPWHRGKAPEDDGTRYFTDPLTGKRMKAERIGKAVRR